MTPRIGFVTPLLVAWLRVAFLPVILLQERTLEHPTADYAPFASMSWIALATRCWRSCTCCDRRDPCASCPTPWPT